MKMITIHGYVGKWNSAKKYLFTPIHVTADEKNIVLYENERGNDISKFTVGGSVRGWNSRTGEVAEIEDSTCDLFARTIDSNGPHYGASVIGSRVEMDLTREEYYRLMLLLTDVKLRLVFKREDMDGLVKSHTFKHANSAYGGLVQTIEDGRIIINGPELFECIIQYCDTNNIQFGIQECVRSRSSRCSSGEPGNE